MARNNDRDRDRGSKRTAKDTRPRGKTKVCIFCKEHATGVDYKDLNLLRRFMSDRGKIRSRRVTGNCARHQREVQVAIKTAREVALLPFAERTVSERGPGRGPRGRRGDEAPERTVGDRAVDLEGIDDEHDEHDEHDEERSHEHESEEVG